MLAIPPYFCSVQALDVATVPAAVQSQVIAIHCLAACTVCMSYAAVKWHHMCNSVCSPPAVQQMQMTHLCTLLCALCIS